MKRRLRTKVRREQLVLTALALAETAGYNRVTREQVAGMLSLTGPIVQYHFGSMRDMRDAVMAAAIESQNLTVLAQGLFLKDPVALAAPAELKRAALDQSMGDLV